MGRIDEATLFRLPRGEGTLRPSNLFGFFSAEPDIGTGVFKRGGLAFAFWR